MFPGVYISDTTSMQCNVHSQSWRSWQCRIIQSYASRVRRAVWITAMFTANHSAPYIISSNQTSCMSHCNVYSQSQCSLHHIIQSDELYEDTAMFTANHSAPYIISSNQMSCVNRCRTETMNRFQSLVFCRWPSNTSRSLIIGWQSVTAHTYINISHFNRLIN